MLLKNKTFIDIYINMYILSAYASQFINYRPVIIVIIIVVYT